MKTWVMQVIAIAFCLFLVGYMIEARIDKEKYKAIYNDEKNHCSLCSTTVYKVSDCYGNTRVVNLSVYTGLTK